MDIKYNQTTASIEIKDGLKTHLFIMKFLMIVTLINAILNISNGQVVFGFMKVIWLALGMVAVVILYNYIFKKTGLETIAAHQIKEVNERVFFGRKKYFIVLKNGKTRDLLEVKSESQFKEIKKMVAKIKV